MSYILKPIDLTKRAIRRAVFAVLDGFFRLARYLYLANDPARAVHNAEAGLLDRNVQSSKMVHAALLLLMLEAAHTDLVSPSA